MWGQTLKQASLQEYPKGTMRIQVPIDSRNSAIQHVYHTLLHPSSSSQPRHPMLKIVANRANTPEGKKRQNEQARQSDAQTNLQSSSSSSSPRINGRHPWMYVWQQRSSIPPHLFTTPNHCAPVINVQMILPQVHLRKPCYDFSFL